MTRDDFLRLVDEQEPQDLAQQFLFTSEVTVFDSRAYAAFRERVSAAVEDVEHVAIVGSGNWRYSLNPRNNFSEFHRRSDIDVAVVSRSQYQKWWDYMRKHHREKYYVLTHEERSAVRRSGENVYAGFISPMWIPRCDHGIIYAYKAMLNKLSDKFVGSVLSRSSRFTSGTTRSKQCLMS